MVPVIMGWDWDWIFPLVGMGMIISVGWALVTRGVNGHRKDSSSRPSWDPLALARERYAQGLIAKSEFERLVADLLDTEHPDTFSPGTFHNDRGVGLGCGPADGAGCGRRGPGGGW